MNADLNLVAAGAGRMGRSMAVAFAYAGYRISVLDLKTRDADGIAALSANAKAEINSHLATLQRIGVLADEASAATIAARISIEPISHAERVLQQADVVFEGVPEVLDAKQAAFTLMECLWCRPPA